jgi:hypothetical protein
MTLRIETGEKWGEVGNFSPIVADCAMEDENDTFGVFAAAPKLERDSFADDFDIKSFVTKRSIRESTSFNDIRQRFLLSHRLRQRTVDASKPTARIPKRRGC